MTRRCQMMQVFPTWRSVFVRCPYSCTWTFNTHASFRDLGLDDLLKRCERLLEKLRFPENEPCFHVMAGTVLFSHTALEMLHNYNRYVQAEPSQHVLALYRPSSLSLSFRLSAAVEKVELLWQQAFSKPRLQLQVAHLRREAQQVENRNSVELLYFNLRLLISACCVFRFRSR